MSNVLCKLRSTESTSSERFFYFLCQKEFKKPWGQGWVETKVLELKHLLDQKKNRQMKNTLKLRYFSLLWKLANIIKSHYKKREIFFVTPLPPNASGVYTAFSEITQKILITNTCHWLEPITVILGFLKKFTFREKITHFRTIIFSQSPRFQFSNPVLDGLFVSFNAHHFFMQKQFMCVDCYTVRLTFSNIVLHKTAIRWILVASQAEMRKDKCVPEVVAYEGSLIVRNYWREIL